MPSPLDPRDLQIDESDPNWGISDLEWRRAAFIEDLVTVAKGHGEDRHRFISVALRGYQYRLHIDSHRPHAHGTPGVTMALSLPPLWQEAWLWGYQWQPLEGSKAVLGGVSPAVRAGILESLAELGIKPE